MPVTIDKTDHVWTIVHNRPDARNAMDTEHAKALVAAFEDYEASDASVAVLYGEGGNFCAG